MKRAYRILLWVAGALACLVVAVVVFFAFFFQWDWLKGPLEVRLSTSTGKQVALGGVQGTYSWTPRITLSDIRIVDPGWKPPEVGTIGKLVVAIDLRQLLFHGKIDLPELDIEKADLALVKLPDGRTNWAVGKQASGPSNRFNFPLIGSLNIVDSKVSYSAPGNHTFVRMKVGNVQGQGGSGAQPIHVEGEGSYQNAPFKLTMSGDPLSHLRNTKAPYHVELTSELGPTRIAAKGSVTDPVKMAGLDIRMTVEGQNAADLYPYLGVAAPETPPYHLVGTLDRKGDTWFFKSFKGTVGHSDLEGNLEFKTGSKPIFIGGDLVSNNLNLVDLGLAVGAPTKVSPGDKAVSPEQRQVSANYHKSPRVLPNAPLNMAMVQHVNTDVTFKGTHISAQDLPLSDLDLRVRIDNGVLSLDPLSVGVAGGRVAGGVVIDTRDPRVKTDYDLRLSKFQLRDFFAKAGHPEWGSGDIEGRIRLTGYGNTVAKSLGAANGQTSVIVDHGVVSNLMADLMGEDLAKAIGLVISGKENKPVRLRCVVADFDVRDGVMDPKPFLIDTDKSILGMRGQIRLKDETLHLQLNGYPKQATPIDLNSPLDIGGTLKSPTVSPSKQTYARAALAAALGVVATPFASILAFIHPGAQQDTDCSELERNVQKINAAQPPVQPQTPPQSPRAKEGGAQEGKEGGKKGSAGAQ